MGLLLAIFLSCFVPQQTSYTVKNISVVETFVVGPPMQKAAWKTKPTLPEGNIDPDHIAATRIYTVTGTLNIAKAKIFIYPKEVRKQRVIEHELGHALGWVHHDQKYHIMHSNWHLGGFNASGLRKQVD